MHRHETENLSQHSSVQHPDLEFVYGLRTIVLDGVLRMYIFYLLNPS